MCAQFLLVTDVFHEPFRSFFAVITTGCCVGSGESISKEDNYIQFMISIKLYDGND